MTENKGNQTASGLQTLRVQADISKSSSSIQTLEGIEYIALPSVILVEGVHHGSGGPILYNAEELSKFTPAWNTKPVVLYHPEKDGQALSATEPAVLESAKVGMMMNTTFSDGKLRSEVWIDKKKADKVDKRIMEFIQRGEVMELSTGIFFDVEDESGEWNGEQYYGVAKNFRPDHLALLPDQLGACSINDGCGLMRNKDGLESMIEKIDNTMFDRLKNGVGELAILLGIKSDTSSFKPKVVDNISQNDLRRQLEQEIAERFASGKDEYAWVEDVFDDVVIFQKDQNTFSIGYSVAENVATLDSGDAVEVDRHTIYKTVEGSVVGNRDQKQTKESNNMPTEPNPKPDANKAAEEKNKVIGEIIANCGCQELKREALEALSDEQLEIVKSAQTPKVIENKKTDAPKGETPAANKSEAKPSEPVKGGEQKMTLNEWREYSRKCELVANITAQESNEFTDAELSEMTVSQLEKLNKFVPAKQEPENVTPFGNYALQGRVDNGDADMEPLPLPTYNYGQAK